MATYSEKVRSFNSLRVASSGKNDQDAVDAMKITPTANAAAANVLTITNASHGQATTLTVPDVGGATGKIPVASGALVSGNLLQASGTTGVFVDSGISGANVVTSTTGTVATVSVTLNTSQVTGMFATPVQLIATPGAGKLILVQEASVYTASTGNTAYASGGVAIIQYDNTANGAGTNAMATTIAAANITTATSKVLAGVLPSTTALSGVTNKGVFLSNQTGAFTNGTGTNVTVFLTYQVITATV